jgi:hypothetical protein
VTRIVQYLQRYAENPKDRGTQSWRPCKALPSRLLLTCASTQSRHGHAFVA